jgi:uncharacterized protein (TIGR02328 family)
MRLWHQSLIPYLDRQRLLSQHRECAALRGKGWGKKHATVDYVFKHNPCLLVAYHRLVMDEMERRGYHPDRKWDVPQWRGDKLEFDPLFTDNDMVDDQYCYARNKQGIIYPEHNKAYLNECIALLKEKEAPIDWEQVERGLSFEICNVEFNSGLRQ